MKAENYREMSKEELDHALMDSEKQLFELRSQAVTEKLENSKGLKNLRRDIARIKTILREKETVGK